PTQSLHSFPTRRSSDLNLLPASQVLNQAIKSLERSERHKRKDKPLLRVAVSAKEQSQEEGRQIGDQEQEVRDRLIPRHADGEIRPGGQFVACSSEHGRQRNRKRANLQQNQRNQEKGAGNRNSERGAARKLS